METVIVYSPVQDKNIQQNLSGSPIWGEAYHESDLTDTQKKFASMYQYTMKFDGLKPVMVTKVKKVN
jgi:hypothetical protein